ncbi:hypothetical protein [Piscirickettsia salmonis]|uniref:hypothetical protein n=1 Tax=Piscirickettsia salmonis TaxID=1238 RepID=UPI00137BE7BB|nr:hypothetical protein [Piscirickettsia salmonis]QHS27495.1 hypothetical protein GW538_16300 [Piscirickettsia salmonis]
MLGDFASLDVQNTYRGSDAYASISEVRTEPKSISLKYPKTRVALSIGIPNAAEKSSYFKWLV